MAIEVIMPALGMAQDSGKIVRWLRSDGDEIRSGDALLEIETNKSTEEIEAPAQGRLRILRPAGDDPVPVGAVIGLIGSAEEIEGVTAGAPTTEAEALVVSAPSRGVPATLDIRQEGQVTPALPPMSPAARRMAREIGLDIDSLPRSGRPLRLADIQAMARARTSAEKTPTRASEPSVGEAGFRRYQGYGEAMAERTTRSWQAAPHFYLERRVGADGLARWLASVRKKDARATFSDLLLFAVARTLGGFPDLNAHPASGGIRLADGVHVGLAVSTEHGLVVPVIHDAAAKPLSEISADRRTLVEKARTSSLSRRELEGGTITISNLGMYGIDRFAPVLNLDQALLLAVGRIREVPVAEAGKVVVAPMMDLTLACDHRVADGASAALFLTQLAEGLEDPLALVT